MRVAPNAFTLDCSQALLHFSLVHLHIPALARPAENLPSWETPGRGGVCACSGTQPLLPEVPSGAGQAALWGTGILILPAAGLRVQHCRLSGWYRVIRGG